MKEFLDELEDMNIGKIERNVPLYKYTTYRVGGIASAIVYPKNVDSLMKLIRFVRSKDIPFKILGFGSNLLFSSKQYNGILIRLDEFRDLEFFGTSKVRVGAGYSLVKLSLQAAKRGLAGLEFAAGIPGTVGGAVFMNAGAYKSDMGYIVQEVTFLDENLELKTFTNRECDFHYRTSYFKKHPKCICLSTKILLKRGTKEAILAVMEDRRKRRVESQPLEYPSAGSVFRNPEGDYAGRLIESLGYKGKLYGGAMVSEKHANFIINKKHATANDIIDLIHDIQKRVKKEYGIDLKLEQEIVESKSSN